MKFLILIIKETYFEKIVKFWAILFYRNNRCYI